MSYAKQHDIGAVLKAEYGVVGEDTVDSAVTGDTFDRVGAISAKFVVPYSATLAEDETLTVTIQPQHGDESDGSDAADYDRTDAFSAVVATGDTGGSTETGVATLDVRLDEAKQYVRGEVTMATSSTGTANWALAYIVGGKDFVPV